jgi:MFS family permease
MWLLQGANLLGSTANSMAFIAIPWLVLELTGSATSTGLIVGISYLPVIFMAPLAGVLIDRWGRRQVSILSDILSAVSVALIPVFALTMGLTPALILFAALLGAVFDPAGYTARTTLIHPVAQMTGIRLERTNALHEALFSFGFAIGPALAALGIGLIGTVNTFWVIGMMALLAAGCVGVLGPIPTGRGLDDPPPGQWWKDALAGFIAIRRDRAILVLTVFFIAVELVYMPSEVVILPAYFQAAGNPLGMGLVISAMAVGGILGAYSFDPLSQRFSNRQILISAMMLSISALFGLAFFPPVPIMLVAGFLTGMCWGPMGPLINTLVQTRFPESVQGRVFGAQMAVFSAGPPLGMIFAGGLVDQWGVTVVYPALVITLWVMALGVSFLPVFRALNRGQKSSAGDVVDT